MNEIFFPYVTMQKKNKSGVSVIKLKCCKE